MWTGNRADHQHPSADGLRCPDIEELEYANTLEGVVMKDQKARKCAHIPCLCEVADGEEYCGNACRDAGSEDVEIACQCDHPPCPLVA